VIQVEKLYGVNGMSLYRWTYKSACFKKKGYRVVEMRQSSSNKHRALEQNLKHLERRVGEKQIKIDYLEKTRDWGNDELDIDMKKNYHTLQSGGSKITKKK